MYAETNILRENLGNLGDPGSKFVSFYNNHQSLNEYSRQYAQKHSLNLFQDTKTILGDDKNNREAY